MSDDTIRVEKPMKDRNDFQYREQLQYSQKLILMLQKI